jgi:5-methylcytosine-specific restriction endonuclease McrA
MRACSKCLVEKPDGEFFIRDKKTGRLHAQCKACYRAQRQLNYSSHYAKYRDLYIRRAKNRREMLSYLSNKVCNDCGESDIRVLELDHIDPTQKKFSISQAVKLGYDWNSVVEELKKCQILCANCHKKRTAAQFGWYKNIDDIGGADQNRTGI